VADIYRDKGIVCDERGLTISAYYFPAGSKFIAYDRIRGLRRVELNAMRGRARVWGTANFKYWANLDTKRPHKKSGLIVDVGKSVSPFITPDDTDAVEAIIRERSKLPNEPPTKGPFI
jgi:hypothetical protein